MSDIHFWERDQCHGLVYFSASSVFASKRTKKPLRSVNICYTLFRLLSQLQRLYYFIVLTKMKDEVTKHEL